jgi:hypothetical protein
VVALLIGGTAVNNAAFVLIAIGLSVVVSLVIWLASRKPQTFMSSIDDFEREMRALGRDAPNPRSSRARRRAPGLDPRDDLDASEEPRP